jgi:hypothetical protein
MRMMGRLFGMVAIGIPLSGCYTLEPVRGTAPTPGSQVAMDVNDAGRVALGGSMGPTISQVEGRLIERDSSHYLIAVSGVQLLQGGEQVWSGERVRLNSDYVSSVYERRFSKSRTAVMTAASVGTLAVILAKSLFVSPAPQVDIKLPPDTSNAQRLPRRRR